MEAVSTYPSLEIGQGDPVVADNGAARGGRAHISPPTAVRTLVRVGWETRRGTIASIQDGARRDS